ncbi:MAG: Mor transcription activator family protein [Rhodocyclaceae bacterium]
MRTGQLAIMEEDLPKSVRDLVRLVGWRGAMAMVREMPGARIYSPHRGPTWSPQADARFARVAELVGERRALVFYREFAGGLYEVPTCRGAIARARDRAIRAMFDGGASVEQICAAFGLSRRAVFYILKRADEADPSAARPANIGGQLGLF